VENEGVRVDVQKVPGRGYSFEVTARPGTRELDDGEAGRVGPRVPSAGASEVDGGLFGEPAASVAGQRGRGPLLARAPRARVLLSRLGAVLRPPARRG